MDEYECANCGSLSSTSSGPCHNCKLSAPPRTPVGMMDNWLEWTQAGRADDGVITPVVLDLLKGEC